jgi:hypothetical protein
MPRGPLWVPYTTESVKGRNGERRWVGGAPGVWGTQRALAYRSSAQSWLPVASTFTRTRYLLHPATYHSSPAFSRALPPHTHTHTHTHRGAGSATPGQHQARSDILAHKHTYALARVAKHKHKHKHEHKHADGLLGPRWFPRLRLLHLHVRHRGASRRGLGQAASPSKPRVQTSSTRALPADDQRRPVMGDFPRNRCEIPPSRLFARLTPFACFTVCLAACTHDLPQGGEDLSSEFHNDLYTFNFDRRRWFAAELRPSAAGKGAAGKGAGVGGREGGWAGRCWAGSSALSESAKRHKGARATRGLGPQGG